MPLLGAGFRSFPVIRTVDCNETLGRYVKETAGQDARRDVAAPFVLVEKNSPKVIPGY